MGTAGELNRVPSDSNLTAAEIRWYLGEMELDAKTVKFSLKKIQLILLLESSGILTQRKIGL